MTKLCVMSVFDLATQTFGRPFTVPHAAQAFRSFKDEANNPESEICKHPGDYVLYELGTFDDTNGITDNISRIVANASDLKTSA